MQSALPPTLKLDQLRKKVSDLLAKPKTLSEDAFDFFNTYRNLQQEISWEIENNNICLPEEKYSKYCNSVTNITGTAFGQFGEWVFTPMDFAGSKMITNKYNKRIKDPKDIIQMADRVIKEKGPVFTRAECGILIMAIMYSMQDFFEYRIESLELKNEKGCISISDAKEIKLEDLIKPAIKIIVLHAEQKLATNIAQWKSGVDKIECAAFCEMIFKKNYFLSKYAGKRIKAANLFALSRYGLDINIQLQKSKEDDRKKHRILLEKYFL